MHQALPAEVLKVEERVAKGALSLQVWGAMDNYYVVHLLGSWDLVQFVLDGDVLRNWNTFVQATKEAHSKAYRGADRKEGQWVPFYLLAHPGPDIFWITGAACFIDTKISCSLLYSLSLPKTWIDSLQDYKNEQSHECVINRSNYEIMYQSALYSKGSRITRKMGQGFWVGCLYMDSRGASTMLDFIPPLSLI